MSENTALLMSPTEARVSDYVALLKPRVMSLVVFTGFAGMWVAPGFSGMHPLLAVVAMICLAINAGAAGAINMWYDRDIDAQMQRTAERPIPSGKVHPDDALFFSVSLAFFSVGLMGLSVGWYGALWLAFSIVFYAIIFSSLISL